MADRYFTDPYLAAVYDLANPRSRRDDYDFYLPRIMAAGAVMDAGCGSGTLLAEARQSGHTGRLCGLDPAEAMLQRARSYPDIEWILGDLTVPSWRAEFDLIVMTGHAFQAILTDDQITTSLETARRALVDDGVFAFDTRNPAARAWEAWRPENARTITGPDGDHVSMLTQVVEPFDGRTVTFTHTFTGRHPSLPQVSRSTLRFLEADELRERLARAGFQIEAEFGAFDGRAVTSDAPEIVTIARAVA